MNEKEPWQNTLDGQVAKAKSQYQTLLDHYGVQPEVQVVVWPVILEGLNKKPVETINEITGYWREAFGSDGDQDPDQQKSPANINIDPETGLPLAEALIYERKKKRWKEALANTKGSGGKRGKGRK